MDRYLLYFPEEFPMQLDQDEIIEILDQSKSPEWHAAMIPANIDIFEMNYEEAISYFKRLKKLEKICLTNGPAPNTTTVDNKKAVTSSVGVGKAKKCSSKMWCHFCDKRSHNMVNCRTIAKANSSKTVILNRKLFREKVFGFSF
jgi:FMN phosphatase YigB (HAD superfamily)